jgi:hypothetical protein
VPGPGGLSGVMEFTPILPPGSKLLTETFTFTVPTGITNLLVEMWGGGGEGGFGATVPSGGGGSGAYSRGVIPVTPGATYQVIVGLPVSLTPKLVFEEFTHERVRVQIPRIMCINAQRLGSQI